MPNDYNLELVGAHLLDKLAEENPQITEDLKKLVEDKPDFLDMVGGADVIGTLFTMSDEDFDVLQDSLNQAITETFNTHEFDEIITTAMIEGGLTIDSIDDDMDTLIYVIDSIDELSDIKKAFARRVLIQMGDAIKTRLGAVEIVSIPYTKTEDAKEPSYARIGDAGMDIYAKEEYTLEPGQSIIVPTGIKMAIPEGYAILIQPRSGLSAKTKLRIANTPGLIDSGYRDEIGVIIENIEPPFKDIEYEFDNNGEIHIKSILHGNAYTISEGDRIAQMRLVKVPQAHLVEVPSVENIGVNRQGGFGHTGK